jgi:anti-anti-sigma regulatory factor
VTQVTGVGATRSIGDGATRVAWSGSTDALLADVDAAVEGGAHDVVVDLAGAGVLDARTLTALHRAARTLRRRAGRLILVALEPSLASLLHLTLLERSFVVATSPEDAARLLE